MAFDVPFDVRPSHFYGHHRVTLAMCDFASAGNGWHPGNSLRVWLPQPLFLGGAYATGAWRLMYPELSEPPVMPV